MQGIEVFVVDGSSDCLSTNDNCIPLTSICGRLEASVCNTCSGVLLDIYNPQVHSDWGEVITHSCPQQVPISGVSTTEFGIW